MGDSWWDNWSIWSIVSCDGPYCEFDTIILWVCGFMCLEVILVFWLSARRHAAKINHPVIQRACIRIMLIGPVYSCFMWIALRWKSYDYLCAIPIGMYEGYAMLSFFEILVVYVGGEHKATLALASQSRGGRHTCNFYYTCDICCTTPNLGKFRSTPTGFCSCVRLQSPQELYRFLKMGVAQFSVIKPLVSILMAIFYYLPDVWPWASSYVKFLRVFNLFTLLWAGMALLQMYCAVLPRLRGLGGEKVFLLLNMVIGIIVIQEFVTSALVLEAAFQEWDTDRSFDLDITNLMSVRVLAAITIFEFAIFSNIFYRYFLPEVFEGTPSLMWHDGLEKRMPVNKFLAEVFLFHHIFDDERAWDRLDSQHYGTANMGGAAAKAAEEKMPDVAKRGNGAAEEVDTDETTRLL